MDNRLPTNVHQKNRRPTGLSRRQDLNLQIDDFMVIRVGHFATPTFGKLFLKKYGSGFGLETQEDCLSPILHSQLWRSRFLLGLFFAFFYFSKALKKCQISLKKRQAQCPLWVFNPTPVLRGVYGFYPRNYINRRRALPSDGSAPDFV